jgi:D-psicose/D-tagatose/L-ribulose 3-epimerase
MDDALTRERSLTVRLTLMSTAWNTPWFDEPSQDGPARDLDLLERLGRTAEVGFDGIDLVIDPMYLNPLERRRLRETSQRLGLPVEAVAFVATALLDLNESVRLHCLDRIRDHLDWACDLDARTLLMPIGQFPWEDEVVPTEVIWAWAVDGIREAGRYAENLGLRVALVSEPFPDSLLNSIDRIVRFLDDVGHPSVGAAVGTAHFHLLGATPGEVARLAGRIHHANISDCDGLKHGDLPPGQGVAPLRDYVIALAKAGYDDALSVELEFSPPGAADAWVRDSYKTVSSWLDELSLRGGGSRNL